MNTTPRPWKPLVLALTAVLAFVACSDEGEPQADISSEAGSNDEETTTTTEETTDDTTDTTVDSDSNDDQDTESSDDSGDEPAEVLGTSTGKAPASPLDGTLVPLRLDVNSIERQDGDVVEVRFTVTSADDVNTFEFYAELGEGSPGYDASSAALLDLPNDKKYLVLEDTEGVCLCTDLNNLELPPGASMEMYAQFPAPPEDVKVVDFTLKRFQPVTGLEIG